MFEDEPEDPLEGLRPAAMPYLASIAQCAEDRGFHALLLGAGFGQRLEAFTTAAALLQHTNTIKALVAVRPGFYHPAVAAKLAATVDQHSAGRLLLNVVTGGVPSDLAKYGDTLAHDERYLRTDDFLEVLRKLFSSRTPVDHYGPYFRCEGALLSYGLVGSLGGRIYFGGLSEPAREVAARQADTYLMWGLPVNEVADVIKDMVRRADRHGRQLRFGVRINLVSRPSDEEAWARVDEMVAGADLDVMRAVRQETDSVGQQRMFALAEKGSTRGATYWTGLAKFRVGSGTALVGSYSVVAAELQRYISVGVDTFILSGAPHLEECERVGEAVVPLLE